MITKSALPLNIYHINTLDTMIRIIGILKEDDDSITVSTSLFNRHNGMWYDDDVYTIKKEALCLWRKL